MTLRHQAEGGHTLPLGFLAQRGAKRSAAKQVSASHHPSASLSPRARLKTVVDPLSTTPATAVPPHPRMSERGTFRGRGGGRGGGGDHRGGRGGGRGGAHGAQQAEKPKKENILDLTKYMDKEINVKFNGGREGRIIFVYR